MQLRLSSPLTVFLNVTNACNLRCVYCSADSGVPSRDDLSSDELHTLIDELVALKVCKVIVTGGEPLVRTDIFDLLEHLLAGGVVVSLLTNGTMIRNQVAERLVSLGLSGISISLDGGTASTNDPTRGEGSFERAVVGVRALLDHGVKPAILVTVTSSNWARVAEIVDDLQQLGVPSAAFNLMAPLGRAQGCRTLQLEPEQLRQYAADLRQAKDRHPSFVREDFLHWLQLPDRLASREHAGNARSPAAKPSMLPCDAGKAACAISADGTVYPCNRFTLYPCGNVRETPFSEIWLGERMERIRRLGQTPTFDSAGCGNCRYSEVCAGGCRADALLAFGQLEAPDPHCAVLGDSGVHAFQGEEAVVPLGLKLT